MVTKLAAKIKAKIKAKEAAAKQFQPQQQQSAEETPAKVIRNTICNDSMFATQKEVDAVLDKMHGFWNGWDEFMKSLSEFERCIALEHKIRKWGSKDTMNLEKLNMYLDSTRKWTCAKRAPHEFVKFTNRIISELKENK